MMSLLLKTAGQVGWMPFFLLLIRTPQHPTMSSTSFPLTLHQKHIAVLWASHPHTPLPSPPPLVHPTLHHPNLPTSSPHLTRQTLPSNPHSPSTTLNSVSSPLHFPPLQHQPPTLSHPSQA
ncbi:hypothetical protein BC829DRAFT_405842 [Chytridium lagenaria]|nr:hypothetical protein BC829DRAFT_405842 [Chytridium lagenaria]